MNLSIFSFKKVFPYAVIGGMALFMFQGIFAPGFMSGYDNSFHYYDAHYLTQTLIPEHHWISGWSMQGMAGMPIFVDYYQTGFWVVAFLNMALGFSLIFSYKAMVLFSYFFLGASFYRIASFRFGKAPAFIAAVSMMLQKSIYRDKILDGMWNNYLAIGIFFIFFHLLDRYINSMTARKALVLGLILGVIILTHIFVAVFAFLLLFIYAFPYAAEMMKGKKKIKKILIYALIAVTGVMVSSYYLHGFMVTRDYFLSPGSERIKEGLSWTFRSLFGPIEEGRGVLSEAVINFPIAVRTIFSFFGIYVFIDILRRKKENKNILRFLGCTGAFTLMAFLLSSHIYADLGWWHKIPVITKLQFARLIIYVQIGMYLFAAYGLSKFLRSRILQSFRKEKFFARACIALIAFSAAFHYNYFAKDASQTLDKSANMPDIRKVWQWVDENISPGEARIVYQNTIDNINDPILKRSDVFALSGVFTRVPQIGVSRPASQFPQEEYMRTDDGCIFGESLDTVKSSHIRERMLDFNAKYIVSVEPKLREKLDSSGLFVKKKTFGEFDIFSLKGFKGRWVDFEKGAGCEKLTLGNQIITAEIDNREDNNRALFKFAYHPLWKAYLNARIIMPEEDRGAKEKGGRFGLMSVPLPAKGSYLLVLSFNSFNLPRVTVSCLSFAVSLAIICLKKDKQGHQGNKVTPRTSHVTRRTARVV